MRRSLVFYMILRLYAELGLRYGWNINVSHVTLTATDIFREIETALMPYEPKRGRFGKFEPAADIHAWWNSMSDAFREELAAEIIEGLKRFILNPPF